MKNIARSLAFVVLGFVTSLAIAQIIGAAYSIAFFISAGVIVFTNEREAK